MFYYLRNLQMHFLHFNWKFYLGVLFFFLLGILGFLGEKELREKAYYRGMSDMFQLCYQVGGIIELKETQEIIMCEAIKFAPNLSK